jgi:energy-coupling factor transporter transmembrane protein EcfT
VTRATAMDRTPGLAQRAWLIWSLAAVLVALSTNNPVYRALVTLAALDVLLTWLPRGRSLRPLAVAAAFSAMVAVVVNVVAGHTGQGVLVRIPDAIPVFGGPVTIESIAFGFAVGLGLTAALVAVAPLSLILESHDIVDALPRPLERTGIALATAMNLVSGLGRTFTAVRDAQRMRGWRPRGIRSWNEVMVPVVLTAIEDSVLLAEAMESRGFGAGPRTSYSSHSWRRWDVAVCVSSVAAALLFLGLRVAGVPVDWQPYPTLAVPPIEPILVAACLLLALPAFTPAAEPAR